MKRRLPDADGGLVTITFLFAEKEAGRAWQIWLGDGATGAITPAHSWGWVDADFFLAQNPDAASLVAAPAGLVIFARPKPKDW